MWDVDLHPFLPLSTCWSCQVVISRKLLDVGALIALFFQLASCGTEASCDMSKHLQISQVSTGQGMKILAQHQCCQVIQREREGF